MLLRIVRQQRVSLSRVLFPKTGSGLVRCPPDHFGRFSSTRRMSCSGSAVAKTTFIQGLTDNFLLSVSMGHHGSGNSQADLVTLLSNGGMLRTQRVITAMNSVDRGHFVNLKLGEDGVEDVIVADEHVYANKPLPIGFNATISTPQMHALTLELLQDNLFPGARALDLGSGSGYLTACMAILVTEGSSNGTAYGVEHIGSLVRAARGSARASEPLRTLLHNNRLDFIGSDGQTGLVEEAPFDCIHVGAAVPSQAALEPLLMQLKPGGVCLVPLGKEAEEQALMLYTRLPANDDNEEQQGGGDHSGDDDEDGVEIITLSGGGTTSSDSDGNSSGGRSSGGGSSSGGSVRFVRRCVMTVVCSPLQAVEVQTGQGAEHKLSRAQRREAAKAQLEEWKRDFSARNNGRMPSRDDMFSDERAKQLFEEFTSLTRLQ